LIEKYLNKKLNKNFTKNLEQKHTNEEKGWKTEKMLP
jgi:hypothetical protein